MLLNFFKITIRNFLKNKSYVFINLIGLGLSLACCIVGYLNWNFAAKYDQNHANHERIYKIQVNKSVQGNSIPYGISPFALGKQIEGSIPGISHSTRYIESGLVLKKELKVFNQGVGFAEDDYFEMFTFPFKYGNKEAFLDRSKIILEETIAEAYFGDENPLGQIINIIDEEGNQYPFTVGGVLERIPMNTSMTPDAITHFDNYKKIRNLEDSDWTRFVSGTFVMTEGAEYPQNLVDNLNENYIAVQNEARDNWKVGSYFLEQLTTLGVNAQDIRSNWLNEPPPPPAVKVPMIMAVLMLLIACFNFTNTSIAISSKRLKEIGIRKVMGSGKKQLIAQFMGENLILSFGGLLVGIGLASYLVPAYSALWDFINLELDLATNPEIYLFLSGLLVFTSIVAGAYPSFYISSYQPVKILRGNLTLGGTNMFSKVLLAAQYGLTIIALISSLAFGANAKYQKDYDIGFEHENLLSVRVETQSEFEKYYNLVSQMPEVNEVTGTQHHVGWWTYSRTLRSGEAEIETDMMNLGIEYLDIAGLTMVKGRYFDEELFDFDRQNSIIVNEQLASEFGWDDPIGQSVQLDDTTRLTVVGVMADFYMQGFFDEVEASAFRLSDRDANNFVVIRSSGDLKELEGKLESAWYEVAPNKPFDSDIDENVMAQTNLVNTNIMLMFRFQGILAFILSSIGLYTLVSLNVIKRIKEIGVRKVLGASIESIVVMVNKQFFWLLVISAIVGAALSYFAIDSLMASIFAVYKAIGVFTVVAPFVGLLVLALFIASTRIFMTAVRNPVESLRYE